MYNISSTMGSSATETETTPIVQSGEDLEALQKVEQKYKKDIMNNL